MVVALALVAAVAAPSPVAGQTPPVPPSPTPPDRSVDGGAGPARAAVAAAALDRTDALTPRLAALTSSAMATAGPDARARALGLATTGAGSLRRAPDGAPIVEIRTEGDAALAADAVTGAGGRVLSVHPGLATVTAAVPVARLRPVADLAGVRHVREVLTPLTGTDRSARPARRVAVTSTTAAAATTCPTGVVTEGDVQLGAAAARSTWGVDGTGVRVGILSDSFDQAPFPATSAAVDVAAGDLPGPGNPCGHPTPVVVQADAASGDVADEGRAMAQIVHDLAPGAELAFATAFNGQADFAAQIRGLAAGGADVLVDDVFYLTEPMYQDGPVATAIDDVTAAGVVHLTSAGNANAVDALDRPIASYEATGGFRAVTGGPCPAALTAFGVTTCHDVDPGPGIDVTNALTVAPGGRVLLQLGWSQPLDGVTTDLDLFLVDAGGNVVASSTEGNVVSGSPSEVIDWTSGSGATTTVSVVIGRFSPSGTPRLKWVLHRGDVLAVERPVSQGGDVVGPTTTGHSNTAAAGSVAAVGYDDGRIRSYSSRGPATYCWQPARGAVPAAPISPCTTSDVDVAATDGVANSFFGPFVAGAYRFFGTSAAAPHAAGVTALARQAQPCRTPTELLAGLRTGASPVPDADADVQGSGLIDAGATITALADCGPGPTLCGTMGSGPFPDVGGTHPFCADIAWLAGEGIAGGYADGTFRPSVAVSRQAMAAFLHRAAGAPPFLPSGPPTFPDVGPTHPFYVEIEWLADTGIAGGYADGTFRAAQPVSRQAMAAFLYRAAGEPAFAPPGAPTFPDVPTSSTFFAEIEWLSAQGIAGGYADGTYRPGAAVSRQAMAAFLHRAADL